MDAMTAQSWSRADELRRVVPAFALGVAVVALLADASSVADVLLAAIPVVALASWT